MADRSITVEYGTSSKDCEVDQSSSHLLDLLDVASQGPDRAAGVRYIIRSRIHAVLGRYVSDPSVILDAMRSSDAVISGTCESCDTRAARLTWTVYQVRPLSRS